MVRATPKTFEQDDDDDSDAGVFQQAGPAKRKEAGAAKGSAAAEQDGADGTARKGELQKATSEEWKAQDHATRRRELEAQHKAAMGEWSKRQKLLQPAQVSPATTAGTSPMRRSQFFAGVTPEEVD